MLTTGQRFGGIILFQNVQVGATCSTSSSSTSWPGPAGAGHSYRNGRIWQSATFRRNCRLKSWSAGGEIRTPKSPDYESGLHVQCAPALKEGAARRSSRCPFPFSHLKLSVLGTTSPSLTICGDRVDFRWADSVTYKWLAESASQPLLTAQRSGPIQQPLGRAIAIQARSTRPGPPLLYRQRWSLATTLQQKRLAPRRSPGPQPRPKPLYHGWSTPLSRPWWGSDTWLSAPPISGGIRGTQRTAFS